MYELLIYKGLEAIGRFYSSYRGIVVDNVDSKNMGRLTINIPSISTSAIYAYPKGMDGSLQAGFKWLTPSKGQIVWVEFQNGDFRYPLWTYHGWGLNEMPDELKDPNVLGFVTKNGTKVTFNDSTNKLSIQIADSDNEEKIVTDLSIEKNILNLSVGDGDKVTTSLNIQDGKVSVETSEELSLKGSKIQLNNDSEGLPLASKLVEKLNALEKDINSLKTALVTGSPAVVAVAPTFATVQTWASTQQIKLSIKSDIENKEVLQ